MSDARGMGEKLREKVAEALGVRDVDLIAEGGGGSRAAFRVQTATDPRAAFLRIDDGESGISGTEFDLAREAQILGAIHSCGLPVPAVLATYDDPPATLLEYVSGDSRLGAEQVESAGPEYMGWIAAVHRLDPGSMPVTQHVTLDDAVRADLDWWVDRSRAEALVDVPVLRLAERLLRMRLPERAGPPRFVHGDVGPGNFLVRDGRVAALLDWEMAHLGDPHEDLAWMWMRGVHSDFGEPHDRLADYVEGGGDEIDEDRLRWHLAFVMFKTVVALRSRLSAPGGLRLAVSQFVLLTVYEVLLGNELARWCGSGITLLDEEPETSETVDERLAARAELSLAPDDREAAVALEYLRRSAAHRRWREGALRRDAAAALGGSGDGLVEVIQGCDEGLLGAVTGIVVRDLDRGCWATPPAVRRVRRAQRIGLG